MAKKKNSSTRKSYNVYLTPSAFDTIERLANNNKLTKCEVINKALFVFEDALNDRIPNFRMMKEYLCDCQKAYEQVVEEVSQLKSVQNRLIDLIAKLIHKITNNSYK